MSNQWPELIQRYNSLVEATKNEPVIDLIFDRRIVCHVDRDILFSATELDHRHEFLSGHGELDRIYTRSMTEVILSIADLAEIEGISPTSGTNSPFYVTTGYIHYIPWAFNIIRTHISAMAKALYNNPTEKVPIEDITKFETLLRRFATVTIQFRVEMGNSVNLQTLFNIANKSETANIANDRLFREIEAQTMQECEVLKQLVDLSKTRINLNNHLPMEQVDNELTRINRTFRW